jgi:hypothetical protein
MGHEDDPRVRAALERYQPVSGGARADWRDVASRAARRPRRIPRLRRAGGIAVAAAGVVAGIALIVALIVQAPAEGPRSAGVGERAPDVTFPVVFPDPTYGITAPTTSMAALRGQVVVLAFVDPACRGCAAAADVLGLAPMTPASAMIVVSGESTAGAERFATGAITVTAPATGAPRKAHRGIATAADPDGSLERAFGVHAHPTIVVIDRRGRIARRFATVPSGRALQRYLSRLAARPAPADVPGARAVEPHLGVFDDPATMWDGNPPSLLPRDIPCPYVRGSLRRAATGPGGAALLVGQGLDGGILVVTHYGPQALGSGIGCGAPRTEAARRRALREAEHRGYVSLQTGGTTGRYGLALVTLDGYDTITVDGVAYPIAHNGFIRVFPTKPQRAVISGPAGERRVTLPWAR